MVSSKFSVVENVAAVKSTSWVTLCRRTTTSLLVGSRLAGSGCQGSGTDQVEVCERAIAGAES